ncbi:MAG: hypothetical protein V3U33_09435 [candidate division NC10 bacterium]
MRISRLAPGPAAIVVALSWEAAPLAKHLGLHRHEVHNGITRYRGRGDRVLLLQGGMGQRGVERALAWLEEPSLILSAGFCGGIGPGLGLGEVVITSQVLRDLESFPADPFLLETATHALKTIGLPFHVGTILTVDEVVAPGEGTRGAADRQILAVDMESAYLAEAARRRGVPFLGIRVVSDTPTEPWATEGKLFLEPDGRLKPASLAASLLRHPSRLPRMLRLAPKLRRATRQLAHGIDALLKELEA